MENVKLLKEVKYWPSVGKYCVAFTLPDYECWSDNGWHKDLKKAEEIAMKHVKKYVEFVRELKRSSEKSELVLSL